MTRRFDAATERQVQAAHPLSSTWLAANAGSGKTKVLTDRVARLLLNGVLPQHILCLTYTKAAASEMQNRLFRRLGDWAMKGDDALIRALEALGEEGPVTPERLADARTLFARAIETPGGLKIQTIHSFCASLLRRFPLEAGVSPHFTEIEDRAATLLQAEIVEDFADGPQGELVDGVAAHITDADFAKLTRALVNHRQAFAEPLDAAALWRLLGLRDGDDESALLADVFAGGEVELIARICPALIASGGNNEKAARRLASVTAPNMAALDILEGCLLTGAKSKEPYSARIGSFPTKALREGVLVSEMPALEALMARVEQARPRRAALLAARKSLALHRFAAAFLPEYARRKQLRGWLDFDDQILRARDLLNDPAVAAWVLYRLDGGIDHILVDEAQDTSPDQWDVIEKLAQEFTSGEGSRPETERTIFVVGDKKQSIYSFQGADPDEFDRMQAEFAGRLAARGGLQDMMLEHSFRSSDAILRLVDLVFDGQEEAGFRARDTHIAFKSDLPGRVDLWPAVGPAEDEEDSHWTDPVDRRGNRHHTVILAERIAGFIKRSIDNAETVPVDTDTPGVFARRPVHAGDFLILVQRRSELFAEIIRACKAARLPIAGADRLKVGAELAVKDLAALLNFLATPEDSLALAKALKSPLFGWSEQQLFDLAHRRERRHLWSALRDRRAEFPATLAMLDDLRGQTDFLRPYDLIDRILTRHDGRRKLLGRLGAEAEDGIDALLAQALAYERSDIPSLTGFLVWMQTDDLEIKRQAGGAGRMVRVMTVHGAKGLEAPIVILPDSGPRDAPRAGEIAEVDGHPLWRVNADRMPPPLAQAREAAQARQMAERMRLLYVAMTRAEKWLIVAMAGKTGTSNGSWYETVRDAMLADHAEPFETEGGTAFRRSHGDWDGLPLLDGTEEVAAPPALPALFSTPAPDVAAAPEVLTPSDLEGAKALPGDAGLDEAAALMRGTQIHLLLEHLWPLPRAERAMAAAAILPTLDETARAALLAEASGVLDAPALAPVFAADALAEVPVTAEILGRRFHGVIDRLIVSDSRVLAVDFKTNATVPGTPADTPEGLLRQMGAYAAALGQVYPDRPVETAILWTRNATLMPLPHDLVSAALARSPRLDAGRVAP